MASGADSTKKYVAFVFGWDLFPMQEFLPAETLGLPKQYLHVGVAVYNRLFHFTQDGLHADNTMPRNYRVLTSSVAGSQMFGLTSRTYAEFDGWFMKQARKDFSPNSYHVNNRNCICFAKAACAFLDVEFGGPQVALQKWLEESVLAERFLERVRTNPLLKYLNQTAKKLVPAGEKVSNVVVEGTIIKLFLVDAQMEQQYQLTLSGGVYSKTDASVIEDIEEEN